MNPDTSLKAFRITGQWSGPSQFTKNPFTVVAGTFAAAAKTCERMRAKHFISHPTKAERRARFHATTIESVGGLLIFSRK